MTQGTQKTDNRTDSRNDDSWKKKQLQPVEWESVAYCRSTVHYRQIMLSS